MYYGVWSTVVLPAATRPTNGHLHSRIQRIAKLLSKTLLVALRAKVLLQYHHQREETFDVL